MEFVIKQGNTFPAVEMQVLDPEDEPANLSNVVAVRFFMGRYRKPPLVSGVGYVSDMATSTVKYEWESREQTSVPGGYLAEFELEFMDGRVISVPNDDYITVVIHKSVA